jgi:probable phosphoglycerate mutase
VGRGEGSSPPKSSAATRPHLVTSAAGKSNSAERPSAAKPTQKPTLKGFVKNGVVHLLEGELPENCFVRVTPE